MPRGKPKKTPTKIVPPQSSPSIPLTVSLILPCYWVNRDLIETTEQCLMSLAHSGAKLDEIIIVDDGSPAGMRPEDYFMNLNPHTRVVHVEANRGYTIAVNRGLEAATGNAIVVGNNDLLFTRGWLEAILRPLQQGFDIATLPTIERNAGITTRDEITTGEKFGSLFALTRKVLDTIGNLDEDLGRGYFTDLDFQKRAEDAGFKVGKNYQVAVHHVSKSTFKVVDPEDKMYLDAKERFIKKYGKVW